MNIYFLVRVVFFGVCVFSSQELYEGDHCTLTNGVSGVCKIASDCAEVGLQFKARKIYPTTCGFKGLITIVCCPQPSVNTTNRGDFGGRNDSTEGNVRPIETINPYKKVKQVCEEYNKYNYTTLSSQVGERSAIDDLLPVDENQLNEVMQSFMNSEDEELVTSRVFGGISAEEGEFSHMAALGFGVLGNIEWLCGGSLISESFVLTAAHCLVSRGVAVKWVRLGCLTSSNEAGEHTQQIPVSGWFRHEQYQRPSLYYDIALLKLARKARFDLFVRPACIHPQFVGPADGGCIATGWGGVNESVDSSLTLQKVVLSFQSATLCNNSFQEVMKHSKMLTRGVSNETMLCVGETDGDTCQGDSGGPIQVTLPIGENMYGIVGVTSFGLSGCGGNHVPAIYTRVSYFIPWIVNIVWPQESTVTV